MPFGGGQYDRFQVQPKRNISSAIRATTGKSSAIAPRSFLPRAFLAVTLRQLPSQNLLIPPQPCEEAALTRWSYGEGRPVAPAGETKQASFLHSRRLFRLQGNERDPGDQVCALSPHVACSSTPINRPGTRTIAGQESSIWAFPVPVGAKASTVYFFPWVSLAGSLSGSGDPRDPGKAKRSKTGSAAGAPRQPLDICRSSAERTRSTTSQTGTGNLWMPNLRVPSARICTVLHGTHGMPRRPGSEPITFKTAAAQSNDLRAALSAQDNRTSRGQLPFVIGDSQRLMSDSSTGKRGDGKADALTNHSVSCRQDQYHTLLYIHTSTPATGQFPFYVATRSSGFHQLGELVLSGGVLEERNPEAPEPARAGVRVPYLLRHILANIALRAGRIYLD